MALNSKIVLALDLLYASALDIGSVQYPMQFSPAYNLDSGTGANQAQSLFSDIRTLTASATETLDLAGSLVDAFGATLTFTKIKGLIVRADPANVNDVVVGGVGANAFVSPFGSTSDKINVKPGGLLALFAPDSNGYAVTAGTGDLLKVANGGAGTAVTYTIVLIGV